MFNTSSLTRIFGHHTLNKKVEVESWFAENLFGLDLWDRQAFQIILNNKIRNFKTKILNCKPIKLYCQDFDDFMQQLNSNKACWRACLHYDGASAESKKIGNSSATSLLTLKLLTVISERNLLTTNLLTAQFITRIIFLKIFSWLCFGEWVVIASAKRSWFITFH